MHPFGHADDGIQNISAASRRPFLREKFQIDFEDVDGEILEHIEGGVAAAEIVHENLKAYVLQFFRHGDDLLGIFGVSAFRKLQFQKGRRQAVFFHQRA